MEVCHSYGVSLAIWDHTVLPATWHKWTHPALTPAMQAGTRFTYPGGMEGWVDLVDLIAPRPGVEPMTFRSRVQRSTNATTTMCGLIISCLNCYFTGCANNGCWGVLIPNKILHDFQAVTDGVCRRVRIGLHSLHILSIAQLKINLNCILSCMGPVKLRIKA